MEKDFIDVFRNGENQNEDNNNNQNLNEERRECVICGETAVIFDDENNWLCSDCANFYQD